MEHVVIKLFERSWLTSHPIWQSSIVVDRQNLERLNFNILELFQGVPMATFEVQCLKLILICTRKRLLSFLNLVLNIAGFLAISRQGRPSRCLLKVAKWNSSSWSYCAFTLSMFTLNPILFACFACFLQFGFMWGVCKFPIKQTNSQI